jgi:hypothetical protein
MLDVAIPAGLTLELQAVEPLTGGDARTEIAVACTFHAARLIDLLAGGVAVVAMLIALQRCMGLRERPGRE